MRRKRILLSVGMTIFVISAARTLKSQQTQEYETIKTEVIKVVAKVNDRTITHNELYQRLFRLYGMQILEQMINEILIDEEAKKQNIEVSKKEIDKRFSEIKKQFSNEESFNRWLLERNLTPNELKSQIQLQLIQEKLVVKAKNIKVTKKEVEDFFETNKDRLGTPEQIHCKHILVKTEQEAKDLLFSLRAGADFSTMARAKSEDPASKDRGGDIGFSTRGMLLPEFEDAAFKLKPGEISEPVKTNLGYHIIKLEEKKLAEPAKLDRDMRNRIENALLQNKIASELSRYLQELRQNSKITVF